MCGCFTGDSGPPARERLRMDVPKHLYKYIYIYTNAPTVLLTSVGLAQARPN